MFFQFWIVGSLFTVSPQHPCHDSCVCETLVMTCRGVDLNVLDFELNTYVYLDLRNNFLFSSLQVPEHWSTEDFPHLTHIDFTGTVDYNSVLCFSIINLEHYFPSVNILPVCYNETTPRPFPLTSTPLIHPTSGRPPRPPPVTPKPSFDDQTQRLVGIVLGMVGSVVTVIGVVFIAVFQYKRRQYNALIHTESSDGDNTNLIGERSELERDQTPDQDLTLPKEPTQPPLVKNENEAANIQTQTDFPSSEPTPTGKTIE